jgi:acetyltransferase-like isoleucine patch superfamily enzyme
MRRKLHRIFFHFFKFVIGLIVYFDSRLYMRLYKWLLKKSGLVITGTPRFIAKSAKFDDFNLIAIGDRCVVSSNVIFLTHDYSFTTGLISINEKPKTDIGILRPISVGNNVFIGMNSILLPGVSIGNNVIIGAGSVVRGKVLDNSVFRGNPAVKVSDISEYTLKIKAKNYLKVIDPK